jgi:hypothetical protein
MKKYLIVLFILVSVAFSETILLNNGDKLEGKILQNINGATTIETKYGELKVDNKNIQKIDYSKETDNSMQKSLIAYPLFKTYAKEKEQERIVGGYSTLGAGGLFLALGFGSKDPSTQAASYIISGICLGYSAYYLMVESKANTDLKELDKSLNDSQKETEASLLLKTNAKEGKNKRTNNALIWGALSLYYIAFQPWEEYENYYSNVKKKSSLNMYYGLIYGATALYYGFIDSKEEEVLEVYNKQTSISLLPSIYLQPNQTVVAWNYTL